MAVCERCSAIYFGFFIGVALSPVLSRRLPSAPRGIWTLAVAPMLLDVAAGLLGIHPSTIQTRLVSGALFGITAALILTPLLITASSEITTHYLNKHARCGSKTR